MTSSSVLSSKGQITLPQEIRVRLGLKQGDRVEFVDEGGKTVIRPMRKSRSNIHKFIGFLPAFPGGVDEINAWVRDMRDPDDEAQ